MSGGGDIFVTKLRHTPVAAGAFPRNSLTDGVNALFAHCGASFLGIGSGA
jgi:hypothetical protein